MWHAGNSPSLRSAPKAQATSWPKVVLFEIAWEVCNQVGGIYQVLRSKAPIMVERWSRRYCLLGPHFREKAALEFEPLRASGWLGRTLARVEEQGLVAHHGRWLVSGRPRTVLLDYQQRCSENCGSRYERCTYWYDAKLS